MSRHADGQRSGMAVRQAVAAAALPIVGVLVAVMLWWAATAVFAAERGFLARFGPGPTLVALRDLVTSGELWPHLLASSRRTLVGLAVATLVGIPVGLVVGAHRPTARASAAVFQFLRMVSPLSWTPLAVIVLGVGDMPVYFLVAVGAVWPIILNTAAGVQALDPRWVTVARSLAANRWEVVRAVVWPGIRPHVLTGLRLSVGLAWIILVPAEMLGVDSGLGYFILNARDRLAYGELMATILVIGAYGFLIDLTARRLLRERRRRSRRPATAAPAPAKQDRPARGPLLALRAPVRGRMAGRPPRQTPG